MRRHQSGHVDVYRTVDVQHADCTPMSRALCSVCVPLRYTEALLPQLIKFVWMTLYCSITWRGQDVGLGGGEREWRLPHVRTSTTYIYIYIYQSLFHSSCNNPVQNSPGTKQVGRVHHTVCINSRPLGRVTSLADDRQSVSSLTDWHMPGMGIGERAEFNHLRLKPALERTRDLSPSLLYREIKGLFV